MTSVGRGRGWANPKDHDAVLRRPGKLISPKDPEFHSLIREINDLDIHSTTPLVKVDEIETLIRTAARNKNLKAVFDTLHTQALEDRQFGIRLAALFGNSKISDLQDGDGTKLRNILLSSLQNDYERKEEIKDSSMVQYLNAVSFLGEVYYRVRMVTGEPLPLIGVPLLDYMKTLLQSAAEEDIELVTTQLSINGRKIYTTNQMDLEQFLTYVRTVLVNRNLSSRSRGMLLLAVDLANQRYGPLPGDLQAFYLAQLGAEAMTQIQRHDEDLTIITRSGKHDAKLREQANRNTPSNNVGILTRAPEVESDTEADPERNVKYDTFDQKSYALNVGVVHAVNSSSSLSSTGSAPRAIRGSGARENKKDYRGDKKSPRGKKDKDRLTDEQVWSSKQNNTSKSWGHDDRFDRDYEQSNRSSGPKPSRQEDSWD